MLPALLAAALACMGPPDEVEVQRPKAQKPTPTWVKPQPTPAPKVAPVPVDPTPPSPVTPAPGPVPVPAPSGPQAVGNNHPTLSPADPSMASREPVAPMRAVVFAGADGDWASRPA